jgi:large subunit ribosomal protein L10
MERTQKETVVTDFRALLDSARSVVLAEFRGLSVGKTDALRRSLREGGVTFRVIKNTLAKRAIEGTDLAVLSDRLVGPTAWAFSTEDPITPAKLLVDFIRETKEGLTVKAGYLDGKALDADAVEALAKMPGKDELRSKLLSLFTANATQFVRVLAARPVEFLNVLKARSSELEG